MLDYIDYLSWDAGTGQIMLKQAEFYRDIDNYQPTDSLQLKKEKLLRLFVEGSKKHIALKQKQEYKEVKKYGNILKMPLDKFL